jgi:hypothetical protein
MPKMQKFTIEFSEDAIKLMDHLKERLGKSSRADVLRTSLAVLNFLEQQREEGYQVGVFMQREGEPEKLLKHLEIVR